MDEEKTLPIEVEFAGVRCELIKTTYATADATALLLVDAVDGSLVTTASINVAGVSEHLDSGEETSGKGSRGEQIVLKSYSENEGLMEVLQGAGVVEDTGRRVSTGFVECPVVSLIEARDASDC